MSFVFFFFNDTATTEIYTLSLHDALPISHGAPLGQEEVKLTKQRLGWPSLEPFYVPDEALAHWRLARERGARLEAEWSKQYDAYRQAYPELAAELERRLAGRLADGWDDGLPTFAPPPAPPADAQATRAASGRVLNALRSEERRGGKECRSRWSADH